MKICSIYIYQVVLACLSRSCNRESLSSMSCELTSLPLSFLIMFSMELLPLPLPPAPFTADVFWTFEATTAAVGFLLRILITRASLSSFSLPAIKRDLEPPYSRPRLFRGKFGRFYEDPKPEVPPPVCRVVEEVLFVVGIPGFRSLELLRLFELARP